MGVTIHYSGRFADLARIEEFEDRVLDLALAIGAEAQVWRSWPQDDPNRVVRGLIMNVAPGQDSLSLLIAPEGWLVPLYEIEAAEKGTYSQPPYCFVKTQFGSAEGHVAIVELLTFLKQEFFPGLQVSDEGSYWEERDWQKLIGKLAQLQALIGGLADGLRASPLSPEAAEDPAIVATRIERIARQVHKVLARPPEHPPASFDADTAGSELDETRWDALFREQRRKQERVHRAIEEQLRMGSDPAAAFEEALRQEGLIDLPGDSDGEESPSASGAIDAGPDSEAWRASVSQEWGASDELLDEAPPLPAHRTRHPLQQIASDLSLRVFELSGAIGDRGTSHTGILVQGVGEICGGLAQALMPRVTRFLDIHRGWALVQLKRALRGAAFAQGALFSLLEAKLISPEQGDEMRRELEQLEDGIRQELSLIRE